MQNLTVMFVTAVCFIFLLKLKWPKNKNIYDMFLIYLNAEIVAYILSSGKYFQIWFFPRFGGKKWRRSEHAHASYPGLFFHTPWFSPYMGREERRVQGLDYRRLNYSARKKKKTPFRSSRGLSCLRQNQVKYIGEITISVSNSSSSRFTQNLLITDLEE